MIRIFFAILLLGAPLLMPTPSVAAQRTFTVVNDTDDAVWLNIEYDGPFFILRQPLCTNPHSRNSATIKVQISSLPTTGWNYTINIEHKDCKHPILHSWYFNHVNDQISVSGSRGRWALKR